VRPRHTLAARAQTGAGATHCTHLQHTNGWQATVPGRTTFDITAGYEQHVGEARLKHGLFVKDLLGRDALTPEYLRGVVNALPLGPGPRFGYRLQVAF